jgi:hypothetical protein
MNAMRFRRSTPFILGPLPLPWFDALATLRGGLVQIVGLEIWRQAGLSGSGAFQFSLKRLSRLGKRRQSIYLALRRIEGWISSRLNTETDAVRLFGSQISTTFDLRKEDKCARLSKPLPDSPLSQTPAE